MLTTILAADVLAKGGDGWWPIWPLFWIALVAGVGWLLWRRWGRPRSDGLDRARELLAERYARGELTSDEYRERLEQLQRPQAQNAG
jgi:putative membrane protein